MMTQFKKCMDRRPCFARMRGSRLCTVLNQPYETGMMCPFCKPKIDVTNGRLYPYNKCLGSSFFNSKPRKEEDY